MRRGNRIGIRHFALFQSVLVLMATGLFAAQTPALGQESTPAGYEAYRLEYSNPRDVGDQLQKVLTGRLGQADILIDRRMRRILVRGPAEAHRLTSELIKALDRPAPESGPAAANGPHVRGYQIGNRNLNDLADQLQREFGAQKGVRIAPHPRTNQLIVLAPAAVHQKIERQLGVGQAVEPENRPQPRTRPQQHGQSHLQRNPKRAAMNQPNEAQNPPARSARRSHRLQHVSWKELEDALQRRWADRLNFAAQNNGEILLIRTPHDVTMVIDRRRDEVTLEGPLEPVQGWELIVRTLDAPAPQGNEEIHFVTLQRVKADAIQHTLSLIDKVHTAQQAEKRAAPRNPAPGGNQRRAGLGPLAAVFQRRGRGGQDIQGRGGQAIQGRGGQPPQGQPGRGDVGVAVQPAPGFLGQVEIVPIPGTDMVLIRGNPRDVQRLMEMIAEIERIAAQTRPVFEVYRMRHANDFAVAELINSFYETVLAPRQGVVSITALGSPNAILLVGRRESVNAVMDIIAKLDQPSIPASQYRVFALKHMSSVDAETRLNSAFTDPQGLQPRVRVVGDYRSNTIIVSAGPRDMELVEQILRGIDVPGTPASNEIRIIKLKNAIAQDLAPVIQDAINGQLLGAGRGQVQGAGGQFGAQQQFQAAGQQVAQIHSRSLMFQQIDKKNGGRLLQAPILFDVRVTADTSSNSLVVTAPPDGMELIVALIEELDRLPDATATIKVFTIVNGDATSLADMLQTLFQQQAQGQQGAQVGLAAATGAGETALIPLRFGVDQRTNSVIASGSDGDLRVVEAILLRLDASDIRQRRTEVYRLRNAPSDDIATAINNYLQTEEQALTQVVGALSPFEQIEREVVVVSEPVSNSLIIAATPRYFDQVKELVQRLDERPPMVMIQVVIADVMLNQVTEFGLEWGIQDRLLFDRSVTTLPVNATSDALDPGFLFNNRALGNSASAQSMATRSVLAGQALSHFALGRTNPQLGFGGLVLSAASESVNAMLRALQQRQQVQILSRPQIMTLDNQLGFVQVGADVPFIQSTQLTQFGTVNQVAFVNTGVILAVTPRISPDGIIVMNIDVTRSRVGPEEEGTTIAISQTGDVIRQPQIQIQRAQTTVSAQNGQTIILGGLITKTRDRTQSGIPYLQDLPVLGRLFRFDRDRGERSELLVIMTPIIVRGKDEAEWIKAVESDRMSWVLGDVIEIHGDVGLSPGRIAWDGKKHDDVIFPDEQPTAPLTGPLAGPGEEIIQGPIWHDGPPPQTLVPQQLTPAAPSPTAPTAPAPGERPKAAPDLKMPAESGGPHLDPAVGRAVWRNPPSPVWRRMPPDPYSNQPAGYSPQHSNFRSTQAARDTQAAREW